MTSGRVRTTGLGALTVVLAFGLGVLLGPVVRPAPGGPTGTAPSAPVAETNASPAPVDYVGSFEVTPDKGRIGSEVSARGTGFDPSIELELVWQAFTGAWKLDDTAAKYMGREYGEDLVALATVRTDAGGAFSTSFLVPDGFGFSHDVRVVQDGVVRNQDSFAVEMRVWVTPTSGPPGTPITIEVEGIGVSPLHSSWELTYDNKFTGWLSAVTTNGHARAVIPATGSVGRHVLKVLHGSFTFPYLNMQQSPDPTRPTFTFPFTVTDGPAVLPPEAASQSLAPDAGVPPSGDGPAIWTDPASATMGAPMIVYGRGLTAGAEVTLHWFTVVGNRVGGQGWDETSHQLARVTAGQDGSFEYESTVPDDLGGPHRIEAVVDGSPVAQTTLTITPSAVAISPARGPVGTEIVIHLKGVGWTETANIYNLSYDNGYLGYACGFNSQGDVTIYLPAAGEPGWHFIDLYPGIYKGEDLPGVQNFRIPQLTYADDHPGERLPAFRFAFEVTE